MHPPFEDPELFEAYRKADQDLRRRALEICCILAIGLKLSAVGLDHLIYPQLQLPIFAIRLGASLLMGVIFLLLRAGMFAGRVRLFGILWAMLVQVAVCLMIYLSGDPASPYYAGLNLVVLAIGVLLPWTLAESALVCALTLVCYIAAALLGATGPVPWNLFLSNISFLLFTAAISLTSSHFMSRQRFHEFRLRHQLDKRNRELAELDRLKSEFFANISHEFRTPLTLIISPVDEVLKNAQGLPEDVSGALQLVRQNALRLLKLINDLLELVRLEHARTELRFETLDLAAFLPAMTESMRHLAELKQLQVHVAMPQSPLTVKGDPRRLEKVVLNLLTNAIKFTPAGGRLDVRCFERNGAAVMDISDTGIGIAAADLPHVFQRFHQVDGSATRKSQGLGIGLALARELLLEQHGTLSVRSELGKGTTFTIELPLINSAEAHAAGAVSAAQAEDPIIDIYRRADRTFTTPASCNEPGAAGASAIEPKSATVLIVEDEPDMRRFLVSTLGRDFRVLESGQGNHALQVLREQRPELVLLDLMLPEISGLELCRAIKQDPALRAVRVIVLTARADDAARFEALQHGADDFLTKPFSTLELRARVGNVMRSAQLERLEQEHLRNLNRQTVEGLSTGVMLLNSAGRVLLANPALQAVCNLEHPPATLDALPAALIALVRAALASRQAVHNQEVEFTIEAQSRQALLSVRPIPAAGEQEESLAVMLHDITEYKRLEALAKRRDSLARVGEAVSAINHELRNLLTPIRTQVDKLARMNLDDPVFTHAMGVLPERLAALTKLLDNLRDLGRPIELRLRRIDVAELADSICADLKSSADAAAVRFEKRVENNASECWADGHWLRQAMYNLMRNAAEATEGVDEPCVTLSIRSNERELVLDVADNGCGISPELQPRLFEPFFSTKGERGTGLGLSIARKIVVLHGGNIDAHSQVGRGTTFRVILPSQKLVG